MSTNSVEEKSPAELKFEQMTDEDLKVSRQRSGRNGSGTRKKAVEPEDPVSLEEMYGKPKRKDLYIILGIDPKTAKAYPASQFPLSRKTEVRDLYNGLHTMLTAASLTSCNPE